MHGHERDHAGIVVGNLIGIGNERDPLEEITEIRLGIFVGELLGDGVQFREVLNAGGILGIGGFAQVCKVSGGVEGLVEDLRGVGPLGEQVAQACEHFLKRTKGVDRARSQPDDVVEILQSGAEAQVVALGVRGDHRLRLRPDPALGFVDDAAQVHRVIGVRDRPQVGEGVLDLFAFIEAGAADHPVGQAAADEHLFQRPRLGVGAVEDGDVFRLGVTVVDKPIDLLADVPGFVVLGVRDVPGERCARAEVGPEVLRRATFVAFDDRVRGGKDVLGGAVVLLEQDRARLGIVLFELDDVPDRRAAEGVDRLVRIPHDREFRRWERRRLVPVRRVLAALPALAGVLVADEFAHEHVLGVVGVLIFVDEDVPEAPSIMLRDVREGLEHRHGHHDDVVEVQRVGLAQPLLIAGVGLGEVLLERVVLADGFRVVIGVYELVLQVGDLAGEDLRVEALGIEVEFPAHEGHETLGIGGVVDGETGAQPEVLRLAAQDPHAGGVEGGYPHRPGAGADELFDALAHLRGGLIREGDREDLPRQRAARCEQIGDPVGEHPGLSGAGTGDDEQLPAVVGDGLFLLRVEAVGEFACVRVGGGFVPPVSALAPLQTGQARRFAPLVRQRQVIKQGSHRCPSIRASPDTMSGPPTESRAAPDIWAISTCGALYTRGDPHRTAMATLTTTRPAIPPRYPAVTFFSSRWPRITMAVTTNVMRSLMPIFMWLTVPSPISASPTIRIPEISAVRTPWSMPLATWGLRMFASAEPSTIAQPMRWRTMRIPLTILIQRTLSAAPGNFLTRRHNSGVVVGTITRFAVAAAAPPGPSLTEHCCPAPSMSEARGKLRIESTARRRTPQGPNRSTSLSVRYRTALAIVHPFYYTGGRSNPTKDAPWPPSPSPFPKTASSPLRRGCARSRAVTTQRQRQPPR